MKFFHYTAVLLGAGLVVSGLVELWLSYSAKTLAKDIPDRMAFCFAAASVITPTIVGITAGWKRWNGPYYIAASATIGAVYGGSISTTIAAAALGLGSYVIFLGMHQMMSMKNPKEASHAVSEDREMVINEDGELVYEDEVDLPEEEEFLEEEDFDEEEFLAGEGTAPGPDDPEAYTHIETLHVADAKGLLNRMEREGLEFHVESPHYDPANGDVVTASRGASGQTAEVQIHVYWEHVDRFYELRDRHYKEQTEDNGTSLLESFRSFGVNHDLDYTRENDERPENMGDKRF